MNIASSFSILARAAARRDVVHTRVLCYTGHKSKTGWNPAPKTGLVVVAAGRSSWIVYPSDLRRILATMKVRFHWVLGTAIVVTICLIPPLLWAYEIDLASQIIAVTIAAASVAALATLAFNRVKRTCEKTIDSSVHDDASTPGDIPDDIFCPACGYSLRGAPGAKCPECGYGLASIRSGVCRIPWVRRREIGRFRGFWSTVWMVIVRHKTFCEEFAHAVSFSDARAFRCVSVLHVYIPVLLVTVLFYATVPPEVEVGNPIWQVAATGTVKYGSSFLNRAYIEVWPAVLLHVCFLMLLFAATSGSSYFVRAKSASPRRQHNIMAMSYYTCGSLALIPVLCGGILVVLGLISIAGIWSVGGAWACGVAGGVAVAIWWWNLVRLVRRTMPQLRKKAAILTFGVPATWLGLSILYLIVLPSIVSFVLVVVFSLAD